MRYLNLFAILTLFRVQAVYAADTPDMGEVTAALSAYADAQFGASNVPGFAYVVVKDDQVIAARALGARDSNTGEPVDLDTIFEIGSCSKAFTAAIMAIAVDEGKLQWEDRVRQYLPSFALHASFATRAFQVVDLMSQRSGMPGYALTSMGVLGYEPSRLIRAMRW